LFSSKFRNIFVLRSVSFTFGTLYVTKKNGLNNNDLNLYNFKLFSHQRLWNYSLLSSFFRKHNQSFTKILNRFLKTNNNFTCKYFYVIFLIFILRLHQISIWPSIWNLKTGSDLKRGQWDQRPQAPRIWGTPPTVIELL